MSGESTSGQGERTGEAKAKGPLWHLYMIETAAGALYTGITTNVARRFSEHTAGKRGARALRGKGPLRLVHHHSVGSRSEALRLEAHLKTKSASQKRAWLAEQGARFD